MMMLMAAGGMHSVTRVHSDSDWEIAARPGTVRVSYLATAAAQCAALAVATRERQIHDSSGTAIV